MTKPSSSLANHLLHVTSRALKTQSMKDFLLALRAGHEEIFKAILVNTDAKAGRAAYEEAFSASRRQPRHRRVMELCAWPLFEKASVPGLLSDEDELLWLFALPVLVQFPKGPQEYVMMPGDALDLTKVLEVLEGSGCINPKAVLTGFSTLYTREDLQTYGPEALCNRFVQAEAALEGEEFSVPLPLPVMLDPEIESGRARTLLCLFAARMPVSEKKMFIPGASWPLDKLSSVLEQSLKSVDVEVEAVHAGEPCSVSELLLRCSASGVKELERWIDLGIAEYQIKSLYLTVPVDGMAELVGVTEDGEELMLAPTFSYAEPVQTLTNCCADICRERRLPFKGMFSSAAPTSSALH